ncbi:MULTISPECIES: SPOR domain-containing protein [Micrococcaceae]|uniref:SPOR domain-containing protein n=1 Tax=unclassified Kocuria TaxID=2649579 RepID=UPI0010110B64|nr:MULTISPECIES: SPOR domain-containing protein [unclassified Kocuria]
MGTNGSAHVPEDQQFWFNTYTHTVEQGAQSDYRQLLGPYSSREEAQNALNIAQERNEKWDEDDARWKGEA